MADDADDPLVRDFKPGELKEIMEKSEKKREERLQKAVADARPRDEPINVPCPVCGDTTVKVRMRGPQQRYDRNTVYGPGRSTWDLPTPARAVSAFCSGCHVELTAAIALK